MTLTLEILSPTVTRIVEGVEAVFVPGASGAFEVLPRHAAIISLLVEGDVRWRVAGVEESMRVKGGVMRMKDNRIQICAEL